MLVIVLITTHYLLLDISLFLCMFTQDFHKLCVHRADIIIIAYDLAAPLRWVVNLDFF